MSTAKNLADVQRLVRQLLPVSQRERDARLVRSLRKARGWSQREMGIELSVSPNTVARWERGELGMSDRMRRAVARLHD